jgi:phospholipid N-methyltransferase
MKKAKIFLDQGLKNLKTVGTITRSSSFLCKEILKQIEFTSGQVILELGAGDGVITHYILKKMPPDAKLIALEINPVFCDELRKINDDRLIVVDQSAVHLNEILKSLEIEQLDHVISAIPFVIFPENIATQIIQAAFDHMAPMAKFIQVHYSLLAKKMYEKIFGQVNVRFVPFNIPPAFLLTMQKAVVKSPLPSLIL